MSNLTQDVPLQPYGQGGRTIDAPVKANAQIYKGAMVSEISGACCTGTTANAGRCVGIAEHAQLGGGSDGATRIKLSTDQIFLMAAGTAAPTDATPLGAPLFMETDNTVGTGGTAGGATFQYAGRFAGIQDDGQVRVYIDFREGEPGGDGRVSGGAITDSASSTVQRAGRLTVFSCPTLSQNCAVTIGTTGAVVGDVVKINRSDTNAHTLALVNGGAGAGTLATLVVSKVGYIQAAFDGTNWYLDGVSAT